MSHASLNNSNYIRDVTQYYTAAGETPSKLKERRCDISNKQMSQYCTIRQDLKANPRVIQKAFPCLPLRKII